MACAVSSGDENGWPVVMPERYGAVPQVAIKASELAGTWEGIDLAYEYGKQRVSTEFTLNADGSMTGGTAWPNVKVWNFRYFFQHPHHRYYQAQGTA